MPDPVRNVVEALQNTGHDAWITGSAAIRCVRDSAPGPITLTTNASPDRILEIFRRAVPIAIGATGRGHLVVPSPTAPIDLRCAPAVPADALFATQPFTAQAFGLDPVRERIADPFDGLRDLAAGTLRAVPAAPLSPLAPLRAARLVAAFGLAADAELVARLAAVTPRSLTAEPVQLRAALEGLLASAHPGDGIRLLRETGLEAALFGTLPDDAAACVDRTPPILALRWAAWLQGRPPVAALTRLRVPAPRRQRIQRIAHLHPIDDALRREPGTTFRKLRRFPPQIADDLVTLRRAELEARGATPDAFARLERSADRIRDDRAAAAREAIPLALDGREVMEAAALAPGPAVGRAIEALRRFVAEDPSRNEPQQLRAELERLGADADR